MKKQAVLAAMLAGIGVSMILPQGNREILAAEAEIKTIQEPVQVTVQEKEEAKEVVPTVPQNPCRTYEEGMAAYITSVNETVTETEAMAMANCMLEQAEKRDIDANLLLAVAHTESTYYSDAVSCADYKGLMQTGDILAEEAGYSPESLFDPEVSIEVGAEYIEDQLENFDDDLCLALTAYNQGPGAVYEGNYDTGYAELTMKRVERIENFLQKGGYTGE
ncbi:MAG: transglycosylase SLT domain-containing protein [Firmicutes bacterium]|nr:transglycosylase SLT domain-containing protein [Bacillota bacterium]